MNIDELKKILNHFNKNIKFDCDLKNKSWFNIGGKSKVFFKADDLKDLVEFLKLIVRKEKIFILGFLFAIICVQCIA